MRATNPDGGGYAFSCWSRGAIAAPKLPHRNGPAMFSSVDAILLGDRGKVRTDGLGGLGQGVVRDRGGAIGVKGTAAKTLEIVRSETC